MSDSQQQALIDQTFQSLKRGKKFHDNFAEKFKKQYLISGNLMEYWRERFTIKVPPDLNPQTCMDLTNQLIELHQEANFYKAEAEARYVAYKKTHAERESICYTSLLAQYESKKPTATALEHMVNVELVDIIGAMTHAEIELNFWKDILLDLSHVRKIVEVNTMNLGIEAKIMNNEKMISKMNQKEDPWT